MDIRISGWRCYDIPMHVLDTAHPGQPEVLKGTAAGALSIGPQGVDKLEAAGLLPARTYTAVGRLLDLPELRAGTTPAGKAIPVLRLGGPGIDEGEGEPGRRTGFHVDMSDSELEAAGFRWWSKRSGGTLPLHAGFMLIAVGPLFVAAADIDPEPAAHSGEKVAYSGELIARGDGHEGWPLSTSSPNLDLALAALRCRCPLRGGPTIMALPTPK